jgi:hypothetical protein
VRCRSPLGLVPVEILESACTTRLPQFASKFQHNSNGTLSIDPTGIPRDYDSGAWIWVTFKVVLVVSSELMGSVHCMITAPLLARNASKGSRSETCNLPFFQNACCTRPLEEENLMHSRQVSGGEFGLFHPRGDLLFEFIETAPQGA